MKIYSVVMKLTYTTDCPTAGRVNRNQVAAEEYETLVFVSSFVLTPTPQPSC